MFIRMWGQLLLAKCWCIEEKDELPQRYYAVSVMKSMMKDSVVFGHLPRKISPVASLCLMKGGTTLCQRLATGVHLSLNVFNFSGH